MYGIFFILSIILLILASYFDIRTKEVPDWIYLLLINLGLWSNLTPINIFTFAIFFLIGYVLYYFDFWGGADSKLLWGIGTFIPTSFIYGKVFYSAILFIVILISCAVLNRVNKNKLELAFVPFMLLAYLTMWFCFFFI